MKNNMLSNCKPVPLEPEHVMKLEDGARSSPSTGYVAVVRTWPQTGPENADLRIATKVLTGQETVADVMAWASKLDYTTNVTITKAT